MGQILSQPVVEKHSEEGKDKHLAYGISCMQGWRINMEDAHATVLNLAALKPESENDEDAEDEKSEKIKEIDEDDIKADDDEEKTAEADDSTEHIAFFGVYDGHGGEKAAIFTGKHLHHIVKSTEAYAKGDYINALKEGFLSCDQAILKDFYMRDDESGCAATSVIITPDKIVCGNAGDSRTIMSINGFAKALSYDHKPSNEGEKARICTAGGYVDMGRVNGNLALSRGIGDFEFKKNIDLPAEEQIVTCYPDVIQHNIDLDQDEFVVLACDGIWDCLTSQKCVECVRRGISERKSLTTICEEIMELCCAPTSDGSGIGCDNMSIAIVALLDVRKGETLEQWYEKIIKRIEESEKGDSLKYGRISAPYSEIYKQMYGEFYEIGQQSQGTNSRNNGSGLSGISNGGSIFGRQAYDEQEAGQAEGHLEDGDLGNGAISLQKLLASNAITNENGVIYLDTSSAQSLLAHFGMSDEGAEEDDEDDVHDKHIEEEIDEEDETHEEASDSKP
ncbi:phosphatase 2C-like domain-containing protein [Scheffersomyces xylosifermentans]|uniref:phosphatase 2C-like domain-containing protein n=1 Tax=Scheffersomyces xylosifermentans TaxID=1304137 RepID=UPI00315CA9F0